VENLWITDGKNNNKPPIFHIIQESQKMGGKIQYIPPLKQQFCTLLSSTLLFHIILSTTFINCGKLYNSFTNNDLISTNQWDKWK